jgi:hypothetical protein
LALIPFYSNAAARETNAAAREMESVTALHFKWIRGTIVFVEKSEFKKARKISRSAEKMRARKVVESESHSPLSCEVHSSQGRVLHTEYFSDPSLRSVEIQEKDENQLRRYSVKVDTTDLFVNVSSADSGAQSIRFFHRTFLTSGPLPKQGVAKTPIAVFNLRGEAQ